MHPRMTAIEIVAALKARSLSVTLKLGFEALIRICRKLDRDYMQRKLGKFCPVLVN